MSSQPPPLPKSPDLSGGFQPAPQKGKRGVVKVVLAVVAALIGGLVIFAGLIYLFIASAEDFELSEAQRSCLITIDDLSEKFDEIEADPELGVLDSKRYFDGSLEMFYFYDDYDVGIQLDCTLTVERKLSDATTSYFMEWQTMKASLKFEDVDIKLEEADDVLSWGDNSKFAYQVSDGDREGIVFIGRKGKKIFFLDCWGVEFENEEEIRAFILPHLERYATTEF